ncbi:hypothetical protein DY000_02048650 [Brassica cretica]|uniref:Uncharacterized protein n=1 Tax=Brassica cretica TaxID=69181 RepID=A0ABQ7EUZ9_BRACR|nr:hypothetical protein DY000_02048650 [Brassica cretica]
MELRPSPGLEDRSDRASTRPSQPSRQAKTNSRGRLDRARRNLDRARLDLDSQARLDLDHARLDLDREVSQNDRDFSLLVRLTRTECSKDRADGLTLITVLVSCRVILQVNKSSLVGLNVTFQTTIEAGSIIRPFRNLDVSLSLSLLKSLTFYLGHGTLVLCPKTGWFVSSNHGRPDNPYLGSRMLHFPPTLRRDYPNNSQPTPNARSHALNLFEFDDSLFRSRPVTTSLSRYDNV